MKQFHITFDRLERDLPLSGAIRSVEVNHGRRIITVVCDEDTAPIEGQMLPGEMLTTHDEPHERFSNVVTVEDAARAAMEGCQP